LNDFSASPENAKKLKVYTCKTSRAAALISLSEIVAVKDKVASVENKVDALINDGKVLMEKLDAALEKHRAENNAEELATSVASLLGRDVRYIREDLRVNQDELKELLGTNFDRVHLKLKEMDEKLDQVIDRIKRLSPRVSVTGRRYRRSGGKRANVRCAWVRRSERRGWVERLGGKE
jgi:DNA-binding transcriptional regulator YiaG